MRLSGALTEALLMERQFFEVDKEWVDGIRAALTC